jgi:adenosylhomocysteine nucleosidase
VSRRAPGEAAIVVALPWEATPLAKHLGLRRSDVLDGVTRYRGREGRLLLIQAGMGSEGVARALTALDKPSPLLSAGFCGGSSPAAGLGDIVIGSQVVGKAGSFPADPHLLDTASHAFKALGCPFHVGPILTVDEVITSADRMQGRAEPEILAVDMESAHLAEAAQRQGIPFLAIRVVSDTPSTPWATEERHFLKPDGRLKTAALAISLFRHPSRIARLLRLASTLRPATRRLARGIEALLKEVGV